MTALRGVATFVLLALLLVVGIAALSIPIGHLAGLSSLRSVSRGLMLAGAVVFVAGAGVGVRDPARLPASRVLTFRSRNTPDTWSEAFHLSAFLVSLGLALTIIGMAVDPDVRLL